MSVYTNREMLVNYGTNTQWSLLNIIFMRFLMTCKTVYDKTLRRAECKNIWHVHIKRLEKIQENTNKKIFR